MQRSDPSAVLSRLTPGERKVVELLRSGMRNAEVAVALGLSEQTIRNHLRSIYVRFGVAAIGFALVLDAVKAAVFHRF